MLGPSTVLEQDDNACEIGFSFLSASAVLFLLVFVYSVPQQAICHPVALQYVDEEDWGNGIVLEGWGDSLELLKKPCDYVHSMQTLASVSSLMTF